MIWQDAFRARQTTPSEAVARLGPGKSIFLGTACSEPQTLVAALLADARCSDDAELIQLLPLGLAPYTDARFAGRFRHNSFFIGQPARAAVHEGRADYTPVSLSDIPVLLRRGLTRIDVALITVAPPDEYGFVSLGVNVDIVRTAIEEADLVIAEVNESMPRTTGESSLPVDAIDWFVEAGHPVLEFEAPEPGEVQRRVARNVAQLIEDGATIETGIGVIPSAVLEFLQGHRDLGIHSELVGDAIVDLIEAGAVTNRRKGLQPGQGVVSFALGTRRLFDFVAGNPGIAFHPTEYVNDPFTIARNSKMTAINVALEVDITGQVAADSIGPAFYSGIGGQVDFIRGAARSPGGRPIICLPSTTDDGERSRIVACLTPGAGVVTPRSDVHFVVTEYGYAYLFGRSIRERVLSLVQIAHPRFRDELMAYAHENGWTDPSVAVAPAEKVAYPSDLERDVELKDGTRIRLRPIKPSDEDALKDFFYALEDDSLYTRFFRPRVRISKERRLAMKDLDYDRHMAIGGFLGEPGSEELIGVANYVRDPATKLAEVALVVRDDWQRRGLGIRMMHVLAEIARSQGLRGFRADVLAHNRSVIKLLQKSGLAMQSRVEDGVYCITLGFESPAVAAESEGRT